MDLLNAIHQDILAGLQRSEKDRMDAARMNHDFYRGDFALHRSRPVTNDYESARYERESLVMQRVVHVLTQHLYAKGPARTLPDDDAAGEWLDAQYEREGVDALMQDADRLAFVGDVAAIQATATGDPGRPVRFQLWPAHQFLAWESEDDPTEIEAVATIDFYDQQRRLRLFTADVIAEYRTEKLGPGQTWGGTAYSLVKSDDNPYGVLPFAFVHANPPTTCFWSGGPGDNLRTLNDYANYYLTEVGDDIRYNGKPIINIFGVGDGWQPPKPIRPGDVWFPPAAGIDEAGNGIPPSISYLQADMGFIGEGWADLQSYLDHSLECYGVPPAAVRMVQSSAKSGVALVAEQLPLIAWAMGRQRAFARYEKRLAKVTLAVGGLGAKADGLALRWPSLVPDVPMFGADQDQADQWALSVGLTSRVQLVMRRLNLTREAALDHLKAVADDLKEEQTLGLPPIPTGPAAVSTNPTNASESDGESE